MSAPQLIFLVRETVMKPCGFTAGSLLHFVNGPEAGKEERAKLRQTSSDFAEAKSPKSGSGYLSKTITHPELGDALITLSCVFIYAYACLIFFKL